MTCMHSKAGLSHADHASALCTARTAPASCTSRQKCEARLEMTKVRAPGRRAQAGRPQRIFACMQSAGIGHAFACTAARRARTWHAARRPPVTLYRRKKKVKKDDTKQNRYRVLLFLLFNLFLRRRRRRRVAQPHESVAGGRHWTAARTRVADPARHGRRRRRRRAAAEAPAVGLHADIKTLFLCFFVALVSLSFILIQKGSSCFNARLVLVLLLSLSVWCVLPAR
mgnify:CR=1 FL=1